MKRPYLTLIVLLFFIGCASEPASEETAVNPPPNILFLIADDWSFPHAGAYGDGVVRTPSFDRLASEGTLFLNAYCAAPSCSPSRASILTGRYPHQLESAANLWSIIPARYPNWIQLLEEQGFHTGKTRKGWGPGDYEAGGYDLNPAGKNYENFETFYRAKKEGQPFSFWFGSSDPHRTYVPNSGISTGMRLEDVAVPGFLPDLDCIRNDILDYYFEVERFDRECGQILTFLEELGELDNTLIVMTSDNGMPFPRAKANLYDYGSRMPLVIRWPAGQWSGTSESSFVSFVDFAPTILEAAGVEVPAGMTGRSLWRMMTGESKGRDKVYLERERHANVRAGDGSYPMRAVRTNEFLYIRNFFPDRWPAGDPSVHQAVGQFGDIDNSISKFLIMDMQDANMEPDYFGLSFGKRPGRELYDVINDPYQLHNLAGDSDYSGVLRELDRNLEDWMKKTGDIRLEDPQTIYWDTVHYVADYQFENYDFQSMIDEYRIKPVRGSREGIPCR